MRGVLIIEDDKDIADLLQELIQMTFGGLEVDVAYSGAAGIESARRLCPAIVLCDLDLPDMDGYTVARSLRADLGFSGMRLIACSGYDREEDRTRSLAAGFDLHLAKPVEPELLEWLVSDSGAAIPLPKLG